MFIKNNNIKLKRKIDGKMNLYSCSNDCIFKNFGTIKNEKLATY